MRAWVLLFFFLFLVLPLAHAGRRVYRTASYPEETIDGIVVQGQDDFRTRVRGALALLRNKAYYDFITVQTYVKRIEENNSGQSSMDSNRNPPTILHSRSTAMGDQGWHAGVLVHEACHAKLHAELMANGSYAKTVNLTQNERICMDAQIETMKKFGGYESQIQYLRHADGKHWDRNGDGRLTAKDR